MRPRRKFAFGEAPEAGQVWCWEGNGELHYLVQRRDGYARQGEMWTTINISRAGAPSQVFFHAIDKHIALTRVA